MIKVSFVVAIYNVGQYLPHCIESIINQQMKNIEIPLVNDGSTDDSLAICNSYAARDGRIRALLKYSSILQCVILYRKAVKSKQKYNTSCIYVW